MRRRLVVLGLALLAAGCGMRAREWTEVRLGTEGGYPPFSETAPDGSFRGFDIDLVDAVCAETRLRCTWVRSPWEDMIPALVSRKLDAVVGMSITEERKAKVDFTRKYYATPLVLVARHGSALRPDVAALQGHRVGVERGTVADHYATRFWAKRGVEIIRYRLQDESYLDLEAGRLDAVFTEYLQAVGGFLAEPEGKRFQIVGEQVRGSTPAEQAIIGGGVCIAVRKQDQDLKRILDRGIAAIRANGTYERIARKYFSEDIYGE